MSAPAPAPRPLDELKVRARIRRNAAVRAARAGGADAPTLGTWLEIVAREAGFASYAAARAVLSGTARAGDDQGTLWHAPGCTMLLNRWFADLAEAREARTGRLVLLPYRRQYVVVEDAYLVELGLDPHDPAWAAAGHDLVAASGTQPWAHLALARLRAARQCPGSPAAGRLTG